MQAFHVRYRNTQGTLMRILNAASRRGLDFPYVQAQAEPGESSFMVTLLLDVNPKQVGQLRRDWYAIVDVTEVRITSAESIADQSSTWRDAATSHTSDESARAARA